MSLFKQLSNDGLEQAQDRLGGFSPLETDIYPMTIKALYAGKSAGGAMNLTILADQNGREYRETIYITNKKGENYFINKDDKTKKVPLPGFTIVDDLCLITTGKSLSEQDTEEKVINVYDFDAKKELPKSVQMLTDVVGQKVLLGVIKQIENKNEKSGDEYVPTSETREINIIDKVYHPEQKLTVAEARNGVEVAGFHDSWQERNKGITRDKRTIKEGEAGSNRPPKAAPAGGNTNTPTRPSLFGNKK